MAGMYGYSREAVRVKVKKCESNHIEWRKFSVDPQITTVEVLYSILAKAFDIRSDFSISYRAIDPTGHEQFLAVLSDWDLDAAFLRTHNYSVQTSNEPCLYLRVDIKAFSEANDWEVNSPLTGGGSCSNMNNSQKLEYSPIQQSLGTMGQKYVQNMQTKLPGLIMNHMEKTFSMVQRALNFAEEQIPSYPPRQPLSDTEFRSFLDSVGQILQPNELRKVIFLGGIDPSLRRVVWKHILNVYPNGMTGRERMDYMKRKATEYFRLRDIWKVAVQQGPVNGELAYVTSMVRKDVLRTDRLNQFYAGSDDNQNIASLFNVLTTYALNHPSVSYCQGMSDLASPLLVTMSDEAHAYICFCAIMSRLQANFMLDGIAMTLKFNHLADAIQYYDPEFYDYLKSQQADDLLFCYRWLLLELKREFPFEDSLRMLEVQWSSLRSEPPEKELKLYEKEFTPTPAAQPPILTEDKQQFTNNINQQQQLVKSPANVTSAAAIIMRQPRENHYTKVCALRRQSSSLSLQSNSSSDLLTINNNRLDATKRLNQSLDENISRRNQHLKLRKNVVKSHQSLDEQKMLMLMKSISICETTNDHDDDDDNEDGNDIDKNEEINIKEKSKGIIENIETMTDIITLDENNDDKDQLTKIQFHPTNPFLDDALDDVFMGNNVEILRPNILNDDNKKLNNMENLNIENNDDNNHKKDSKHNNYNSNNNKYGFNHISHKTIMKVPNINSNNHKNTIFSNTGNILTKQLSNKKGGHFKDLKEKIAASKKGILASIDKIENQFELTTSTAILNNRSATPKQSLQDEIIPTSTTNCNNQELKKGQKVIKNFNEFLNFTSSSTTPSLNKNRIADKLIQNSKIHSTQEIFEDNKILATTQTDQQKYRPLIKLKKQSFDDSDSTNTDEQQQNQSLIIKQPLQLQLNTLGLQQQQQKSFDGSSPDDSQDYYPMTTSITRELRLEMENLDRQVFGQNIINERSQKLLNNTTEILYEKFDGSKTSLVDLIDVKDEAILLCPEEENDKVIIRRKKFSKKLNADNEIIITNTTDDTTNINDPMKRISTCSDIFIWENPLHQISGTSSCNFNEILVIDQTNPEESIKYNNTNSTSKICLSSIGTDLNQTILNQNQTTPDEQQDLEYDGDIIIECDGDNINNRIHKSFTPLRFIPPQQQSSSQTNQLNNSINNDSDSDNTIDNNNLWENSNNLNPFFNELQNSNELITTNNIFNDDSCLLNNDDNDDQGVQSIIQSVSNITEYDANLITLNNPIAIINPQLLGCEEAAETNEEQISFSQKQHQQQQQNKLPPPNEFGGGNPFLIFLCLTLLLQHRNTIIKNSMDYNEMAMHFDKMVRKHDVNRVLNQARRMYFEYLKAQNSIAILTNRTTADTSGSVTVDEPTKS